MPPAHSICWIPREVCCWPLYTMIPATPSTRTTMTAIRTVRARWLMVASIGSLAGPLDLFRRSDHRDDADALALRMLDDNHRDPLVLERLASLLERRFAAMNEPG